MRNNVFRRLYFAYETQSVSHATPHTLRVCVSHVIHFYFTYDVAYVTQPNQTTVHIIYRMRFTFVSHAIPHTVHNSSINFYFKFEVLFFVLKFDPDQNVKCFTCGTHHVSHAIPYSVHNQNHPNLYDVSHAKHSVYRMRNTMCETESCRRNYRMRNSMYRMRDIIDHI